MDNENNAPNNCQLSIVNYQSLLKKYWGYDDFRGIQKEIIESIGAGKDTLGLMPTGGGKSITFQVPALAHEGVCIVITPLIALMKDQVSNLRRRGIQASAIYSGMKHDSILMTLENAVFGGVKILYISPERISTSLFLEKLRHMKVSFICVDEAHCISQWGYDFRPSYLSIADIRKELPDTPVLALTATATPEVIDDIQERLHFREKCVYKMSFARKNLAYVVRHTSNKTGQLIHILNHVQGSAIVYVRSRKRTKEYAELLNTSGISATFYHAGLDNQEKDQRQKAWQEDKVRVMVATNAFGMGIDKPDVRVVIHIDCPDCLEAYFQEAGRAGRDGKKSYAVLLYDNNDRSKLQRRVVDTFPDKDFIRQVYDQLAYFYQIGVGSGYNACFEFPLERFCRIYKHFPIPTVSALNILTRAGYIDFKEEDDMQARVMFSVERDDLYKLRGNEPQEDAVIVALLRNYTGLFQGYQYIDEGVIAEQCGLTQPQVYMTLRALTQKHILDFIPQKHIPFIRYTQRREESERLVISKSIYDDLKIRFAERIEKMLEYANSGNICRSRMLLRYFGETNTEDCGQCDVCLNEKRSWTPPESLDGQ
ncbi:RecQ family ATP-dependent DNA helicase [uncultured Prevotella sp.]|uniref:RecQ family ATP-dependent DNA helicase n=1 Tax=uncultured Prevotella sp. TaxID=159272 RepID=UPI00258CFA58|nr:RecQ family ATP-dependent DNA helicase [uncultured Prevotella sp.]